MEAVGDDGADVEAALEHDGHFIPGFVHLAAINAFDGEHGEDDGVPINGHFFFRDSEHGDFCAVAHIGQHVAEGGGITGHLEADVEAFGHGELFLDVFEVLAAGIDGERDAHFAGELEAILVDVGDDDVTGAGVAHDGGGHDADGTRAGDENVLAEQWEGEGGVDGVTERVEDGSDIRIDARAVDPGIGHGQGKVLGKCAGAIDADALGIGAQMATAGQAIAAMAADDVALAADDLAGEKVAHVRADLDDFADEFVADDHGNRDGFSCPVIPFVDVDVSAADAGAVNADEDIIGADFGFGDILEPETRFRFSFDERFH